MGSIKDFSDSLVEEILTEVAAGFLGERKQVEEQLHIFEAYVSQLQAKGREVMKKAALLNYLLVDRGHAEAFYRCIGVAEHPFMAIAGQPEDGVSLPEIPFAIGRKNKYVQTVISAYTWLKAGLDDYLYGSGKRDDAPVTETEEMQAANLRMVMIMADLVNENIKKLTHGKSPSSVIQYARSFNPEIAQKENITGAVSSDYKSTLDRKLAFKLIQPNRLPIEQFPNIPDLVRVRKNIIGYCNSVYPLNKTEIRSRLARLAAVLPAKRP